MSSSGMGRDVHPAFPLPTTASPTLQGALWGGFGEAVVSFHLSPTLSECLLLLRVAFFSLFFERRRSRSTVYDFILLFLHCKVYPMFLFRQKHISTYIEDLGTRKTFNIVLHL